MDYVTNIAPNYIYQVVNNTVTYNSVIYNPGDQFVGLTGISTFTGSGNVIELIALFNLVTELIDRPFDGTFPEQLELYNLISELVQNQNGTIYPERLELYGLSIELGAIKRIASAMLVYC